VSTRDDVAAALDGLAVDVGGELVTLTAYPQLPETIQPWTAWPVWAGAHWISACVADESWRVLLVLPASGSEAQADALDAALWPVRDALVKLGAVTRADPIALAAGDQAQTLPAIAYQLET